MSREEKVLTPADILPLDVYAAQRKSLRQENIARKRRRRIGVGPDATFYFENYDTMWMQIHEMLYIEKGGDEQLRDELEAYNPLIPRGRELVATMMFEIEDAARRAVFLGRMGGVEDCVYLDIGGTRIMARAEDDVDRSREDGKASSVHFFHFPLTEEQAAHFKSGAYKVLLGIEHPHYGHLAILSDEVRDELSQDLN